MSETDRQAMVASIVYRDPRAALAWLEASFGFVRSMVIRMADGSIAHAEMQFGGGYVMIGPDWVSHCASPLATDGRNTQSVHVTLESGLDAHCARARQAGATILREPQDQFYGDRVYAAADLEGHVWSFAQTMRHLTREEAIAASGLTIDGWY